jgi:acyl dehydratase
MLLSYSFGPVHASRRPVTLENTTLDLAYLPTIYCIGISVAVICPPSEREALFPVPPHAPDEVFGKSTISRSRPSNKGLEEVNVVLTDREIADRSVSWMEPVLCKG